jgi:glycosyltransferase involved in cell wall biosynthesis
MLSVIICTYNREKYIYNVLKSLANNTLPHNCFEIILVDNNCVDNTHGECDRFTLDFPDVRFRYFVETNQGLSHARNRGIKESTGDILVYVDDDALVNNEYLRTYYDFFNRHPDIDAAGGPIIPKYETEEPSWMSHFTRSLITGYKYLGDKAKEFPKNDYPGGGNAAYRSSVFEKVGLYNVDLGRKGDSLVGAEEKDIFDKMVSLGMRLYYLPNAILYHLIPEKKLSKDYFDRLTYSIGKSERMRTQALGKGKYVKRLFSECIKWAASIVLCIGHTLIGSPKKGWKLIQFRWNVTKGLLGQ